jgi:adenylate kinase
VMNSGGLVSDDIVVGIIKEAIKAPECSNGFILDGFPRSVEQAVALHDMLERRNLKLDAVLEFRVPEDELVQRLEGRGRADDTEDVIRNRMKVYRDETAPLLDYYQHELKTVDAVGALDEVFARALRALGR